MLAGADPQLVDAAIRALKGSVLVGPGPAKLTTDPPFRQTTDVIAAARVKGLPTAEMEDCCALLACPNTKQGGALLGTVTNATGSQTRTLRREKHREQTRRCPFQKRRRRI